MQGCHETLKSDSCKLNHSDDPPSAGLDGDLSIESPVAVAHLLLHRSIQVWSLYLQVMCMLFAFQKLFRTRNIVRLRKPPFAYRS
jgi:hypothetical protein